MPDAARPHSPHYDEHYWSGGPAEKSHVFLYGNHLPQRFAGAGEGAVFIVAELGLGTALNFLLTAHLWQQAAHPQARLTFISYEKHPLTRDELTPIHAAFPTALHPLSQVFLNFYTPHPGWNTWHLTSAITLHLYIGDAADGIPTHPQPADAWFLDGFSPATNPAMWQPELLVEIFQHTIPGGTASTYSVARLVKESLTAAGFHIEKAPGHPPKRHMLQARKP